MTLLHFNDFASFNDMTKYALILVRELLVKMLSSLVLSAELGLNFVLDFLSKLCGLFANPSTHFSMTILISALAHVVQSRESSAIRCVEEQRRKLNDKICSLYGPIIGNRMLFKYSTFNTFKLTHETNST